MKKERVYSTTIFFLEIAFFFLSLYFCYFFKIFELHPQYIVNYTIDVVSLIILVLMCIAIISNKKLAKSDQIFIFITFTLAYTLFLDICAWGVQGVPKWSSWNMIVNLLFYSSQFFIPTLSWFYQVEIMQLKGRHITIISKTVVITFIISMIILGLNYFFGYYFTIDYATGIYCRGKYFLLTYVYDFFLFFISVYFALSRKVSRRIKFSFCMMNTLPYVGGFIQGFTFGLSFGYFFSLVALLISYINIQIELKIQLDQTKIQLKSSQINPHFMFNTLASIRALCKVDPELAVTTIDNFSLYLRSNIAATETNELIPFEQELENIRVFSEIEKLRFDNFTVIYELDDKDFKLPALSLQPLFENAVKHGIRNKADGIIKIKTYKNNLFHVIEVSDNGKGFKMEDYEEQQQNKTTGTHIGLKNVEDRITTMCDGTVKINSVEGKGTVIYINIPVNL